MKGLFVGAAMLLVGATQAFATDRAGMGSSAKSWLGTYVGAVVSWDKIKSDDQSYGAPASDRSVSGAVYLGTNFLEAHGFVVGVESDFKIGGGEVDDGNYLLPLEQRYGWSTRLRGGFAIGSLLPFVSAGVAVGEFKADHAGAGSSVDIEKFRRIGFVLGGGADWALTRNFVVRIEYLRSDFGTRDINFYGGSDPHTVKIETEEIRFGGSYKF
jgi:outer membrane immunogenic protein